MPKQVFEVESTDFGAAYAQAARSFLDTAQTNEIAQATYKAVRRGKDSAYLVPAVDFGVTVGLSVCRRVPMPDELLHRGDAVAMVAGMAIVHGISRQLFVEAYQQSPYLSRLDDPTRPSCPERDLTDQDNLLPLCETAVLQATAIYGGAIRALRKEGVVEGLTDVIARSQKLHLVARTGKEREKRIDKQFGPPYARIGNFIVRDGEEPVTLDLHPDTEALFLANIDQESGCPAMLIKSGDGGTLYDRRYHELLQTLVTDDVKVSGGPQPPRRNIEPQRARIFA